MGKFEFENDWGERLHEGATELARGRLPGKLGVLQDVVGYWAIPADERGWMRYGKAILDTFGACYGHYREQQEEREEGRDPARTWLVKEGYERIIPGHGHAFGSFVRRALDGVDFRDVTVKGNGRKRGSLVALDIAQGKRVYFIPAGDERSEDKTVGMWWDGPYARPEHRADFASYVRERIWEIMGTTALSIDTSGQRYHDRIELTAMSDAIDFACGRDEQNDVDALAARCRAFLNAGMSRTLMFHGPPGTGKSTLARALAKGLGSRAVLVSHDAIKRMSQSAHLIIWLLAPGVLILNDIDRGGSDEHRELLHALEVEYSGEDRTLLTCLSVNDLTQLDPALLRPGRVDELREVKEPSRDTTALILGYYMAKLGVALTHDQREVFLEQSEGFSPADIREFCETARAVGSAMALGEIERIRAQREHYAGSRCADYNRHKPKAESKG